MAISKCDYYVDQSVPLQHYQGTVAYKFRARNNHNAAIIVLQDSQRVYCSFTEKLFDTVSPGDFLVKIKGQIQTRVIHKGNTFDICPQCTPGVNVVY